ncbi:MAG: hypothetical protein PHW01_00140 [Patescibacteria group bacterium]|nr:hypothetical protein [Patescibacteria group bacterium]
MKKVEEIKKDGTLQEVVFTTDGGYKIGVTIGIGPRIHHFGLQNKDNLLFWDNQERCRGGWFLYGGHRVWTHRPGADETEEAYAPDNKPCYFGAMDRTWGFWGAQDSVFKIQRGFSITEAGSGAIDVESFIRNGSDMLWSGGVWALTCIDPIGKSFAVPLGGKGDWSTVPMVIFKRWAGHTSRVNDPQFQPDARDELMIIEPRGIEAKRMFAVHQGWIGCYAPHAGCSFFKIAKFETALEERYPRGCNVALYIGLENFMVEMETMSPWVTLKPGEMCAHKETWVLTEPIPWDQTDRIEKVLEPHLEAYNK